MQANDPESGFLQLVQLLDTCAALSSIQELAEVSYCPNDQQEIAASGAAHRDRAVLLPVRGTSHSLLMLCSAIAMLRPYAVVFR